MNLSNVVPLEFFFKVYKNGFVLVICMLLKMDSQIRAEGCRDFNHGADASIFCIIL